MRGSEDKEILQALIHATGGGGSCGRRAAGAALLVMTTPISDDQMRANLAATASYSIAILRRGPIYGTEEAKPLVWEHGRRNMSLRADGVLNVVCPVTDDSDVCGIGIFSTTIDELDKIMRGDPGVAAGVFVYDIHPCRSFPGDALATA